MTGRCIARVMTEVGMVSTGDKKKTFFVAADQYSILRDDAPLAVKLEQVLLAIKAGTFDWKKQPKATLRMAHEAIYGSTPGLNLKCSCKH